MKNQDMDRETASWNTCTTDCSKNQEKISAHLGKRKKCRKKRHCEYLEEWLDKSSAFQHQMDAIPMSEVEDYMPEYCSQYPPFHIPGQQRLFTAASDPSMCHYSVPVSYSVEPVSLPMYPMYHHVLPASRWRSPIPAPSVRPASKAGSRKSNKDRPPPSTRDTWHACHRGNVIENSYRPKAAPRARSNAATVNGEEFTSLPPVTKGEDVLENGKRRFSDPGLGPAPGVSNTSDESDTSTSSVSAPTQAGLIASLVEQVNALKESNRQLFRELRDTRVELQSLKLQASSWKHLSPDYEPGTLSELVREVRDAAKVREEAFISRICTMMKGTDLNKVNCFHAASADNISPKNQKLSHSESQLQNSIPNTSPSAKKEETLNNNAGEDNHLDKQLLNIEKEKLELRQKLQEAVTSKKEAEAHAQKLEGLVIILRKKINGLSTDERTIGPASSEHSPCISLENTSESLASTVSSVSCLPHVTISGPVTQL